MIVGAGSAGCVLANGLSEDGSAAVLLLEAGGWDGKLEIRIPAAFVKLYRSDVDWGYSTAPQTGLAGREIYFPRGKTLGGSSSINAQMVIRAPPCRLRRLGRGQQLRLGVGGCPPHSTAAQACGVR
jgi:choline dehydrogenase